MNNNQIYELTWKDGSKVLAYLKVFANRVFWEDEQGYELREDGWINCEKL